MHIESIELGSNRFDSINNSDELAQKILYSYFDLFDKTIIEVDDESLPVEWYKTYFNEDSELITFTPYSIEYNKDLEIVYAIIKKRIIGYNATIPLDWLNYDTLNLLVSCTNGNIKIILDIVREMILIWEINDRIRQEDIKDTIHEVLLNTRSRKLMRSKQPKLYL